MSEYVNLFIEIHLDGDINDTIKEYNYSTNTNPKSKYKNIYIPLTAALINNGVFKTSTYKKNPIDIFLTTTRLKDFLNIERSQIYKHMADQLQGKIRSKQNKINVIQKNNMFDSTKDYLDNIENLENDIINIKNNIQNDNTKIILDLLFDKKKDNYFYYKNKKYKIISKYELIKKNVDNLLPNIYEDYRITTDLIQMRVNEIMSLNNLKIRQDIRNLQAQTSYKLLSKKDQIKEIDNLRMQFEISAMEQAGKEYENNTRKKIKDYALYIVNKFNNYAKRNKLNRNYHYVPGKGVKLVHDRTSNKYISIKLKIEDVNENLKQNFVYNCKTRKKRIHKLYNELFGILPTKSTKRLSQDEYKAYAEFYDAEHKKDDLLNVQEIHDKWMKKSKNEKIALIKATESHPSKKDLRDPRKMTLDDIIDKDGYKESDKSYHNNDNDKLRHKFKELFET